MKTSIAVAALAALIAAPASAAAPVYDACVETVKRDMPAQDWGSALNGCSCLAEKAPEGSALSAELSVLLKLSHEDRMSKASADASAAMSACFS